MNVCSQLDQVCAIAPLKDNMCCFHLGMQHYGTLGVKNPKPTTILGRIAQKPTQDWKEHLSLLSPLTV